MLSANCGFLFGFLAGYYLSYFQIPYVGIILSIVYLLAFTYFPETPSFLLRCKKEEVMLYFNTNTNANVKLNHTILATLYLFLIQSLFPTSQLAEQSFRFYRNVKDGEPMPENIGKEWDELKNRMEETMKSESKIKNNFEYKDLCKWNQQAIWF